MDVTNSFVAIKAKVDGAPEESDFELKSESFSLLVRPESKDVIIKNLYVSVDPYQIHRMKTVNDFQTTSVFATNIGPGEVIDAFGVGKVIASGNPEFQKDDYVVGLLNWGEYCISNGTDLNKLDPMSFPLSYYVGALVTNTFVAIKAQVDGAPKESDFELKTESFSILVKPGSKDVIIKNLYVSIDPYQINRMKTVSASQTTSDFATNIGPGEVIDAYGVGKVIASGNPAFQKDDYVVGLLSWGEYCTYNGPYLNKLEPMGLPLSYYVGTLGLSGLTAYAGFFEICKPKKGEKVFVSAASGSVGNLVGQYAKQLECYVVGCAGNPKKVKLLKEKLGFDEAFNYKEETDLNSALKRYFPDGIDIYFDNVGAEMLEAAILNMNLHGRIAVCGVISEYTDSEKRAIPDMLSVIYKRITIRGFLAGDHMSLYPEFFSTTIDHLNTGKMHVLEDVSFGLESVPSAFVGLFRGDNVGKRVVQVSND